MTRTLGRTLLPLWIEFQHGVSHVELVAISAMGAFNGTALNRRMRKCRFAHGKASVHFLVCDRAKDDDGIGDVHAGRSLSYRDINPIQRLNQSGLSCLCVARIPTRQVQSIVLT